MALMSTVSVRSGDGVALFGAVAWSAFRRHATCRWATFAGRVVHDRPLDAFRSVHGTDRPVIVDLEQDGPPLEVDQAEVTQGEGARQWVRFDRTHASAAEVVASVVRQRAIRDIAIEEPSIEDTVTGIHEAGGRDVE